MRQSLSVRAVLVRAAESSELGLSRATFDPGMPEGSSSTRSASSPSTNEGAPIALQREIAILDDDGRVLKDRRLSRLLK
jgi:hypothetical protein